MAFSSMMKRIFRCLFCKDYRSIPRTRKPFSRRRTDHGSSSLSSSYQSFLSVWSFLSEGGEWKPPSCLVLPIGRRKGPCSSASWDTFPVHHGIGIPCEQIRTHYWTFSGTTYVVGHDLIPIFPISLVRIAIMDSGQVLMSEQNPKRKSSYSSNACYVTVPTVNLRSIDKSLLISFW